jgi:hypothetical protein
MGFVVKFCHETESTDHNRQSRAAWNVRMGDEGNASFNLRQ